MFKIKIFSLSLIFTLAGYDAFAHPLLHLSDYNLSTWEQHSMARKMKAFNEVEKKQFPGNCMRDRKSKYCNYEFSIHCEKQDDPEFSFTSLIKTKDYRKSSTIYEAHNWYTHRGKTIYFKRDIHHDNRVVKRWNHHYSFLRSLAANRIIYKNNYKQLAGGLFNLNARRNEAAVQEGNMFEFYMSPRAHYFKLFHLKEKPEGPSRFYKLRHNAYYSVADCVVGGAN